MASLPAMYRRFPDALSKSYRSRAVIYLSGARDGIRLLSNSRIIPRGNALENTFPPPVTTRQWALLAATAAGIKVPREKKKIKPRRDRILFEAKSGKEHFSQLPESHLL